MCSRCVKYVLCSEPCVYSISGCEVCHSCCVSCISANGEELCPCLYQSVYIWASVWGVIAEVVGIMGVSEK